MAETKNKKQGFSNHLTAFVSLIRLPNLFIILLTMYVSRIFIIGPANEWLTHLKDLNLLTLASVTILVAAAGYIINDYYDIKIDLINKPKKVIIGTILSRRMSLAIQISINAIAVILSLTLSIKITVVILGIIFLLWWYSNRLKRTALIGNIVVSLMTALSVYMISFLEKSNNDLLLIYSIFAFFISLIREIIKDIEDMKGDALFSSKTLPIIWGIRKTKIFLYLLIITLVSLLVIYVKIPQPELLWYFLLIMLPSFILLTIKIILADTVKHFKNLSLWCKIIMLQGVISMIFL